MRSAVMAAQTREVVESQGGVSVDTSFVLFFLALEFGLSAGQGLLQDVFLGGTLASLAVLPFLVIRDSRPSFSQWIIGRLLILLTAVAMGAALRWPLGTTLPETLRFLPLTLLIVAAVSSAYIQFYSFFRYRAAG